MRHFLFADKDFFPTLYRLASPIVVQHFIIFSLGLVDILMIGQLGEAAVAAVGIADQIFFLVILLLFGISSGAAIFTAQYWGKKDVPRIKSVLGLTLLMGVGGALIFSGVSVAAPRWVIGIYSKDPAVVELGGAYLQIVGLTYGVTAVTVSYSAVLRSVENVKLPMFASIVALSLNTVLNYGLIFGHFGLPALGVTGAAIATALARTLEGILLLAVVYGRRLPVAASPAEMFNVGLIPLPQFFRTVMPVVITEIAWSFGITTYNVVYARIGTESVAAINIAVTIERVVFVLFIGMGNACAIMIGNRIGAGEAWRVMRYAQRFLAVGAAAALFTGLAMLALAQPILGLYNVSATTLAYAERILLVMALTMPIRVSNLMILVGMLRSGGDTRFAFFVDAGAIWCVGVPLAFVGAFVLGLPVHLVYLLVMAEEVVKFTGGVWRLFSQKWINNLTVPA